MSDGANHLNARGRTDFPRFLAEVARVLRPGGDFLYADFRFCDGFAEWDGAIAGSPLETVASNDISTEVLRGMDTNGESSRALVENCLPRALHSLGRDFAGVPGSRVYQALAGGQLAYRCWHMRKGN